MTSEHEPRYALRVVAGELYGALLPLDERLEIGRSSSCEVQLLETGISRAHAAIVPEGDGQFVLVDLLSTNGTFVGDQKVSRHALQLHDKFRIGSSEFVFDHYGGVSSAPERDAVGGGRTWQRTQISFEPSQIDPEPEPVRTPDPTTPDGKHYPGNLLGDIVVFRNMRMSLAHKGTLPAALRGRYDRVGDRLRTPVLDSGERRTFLRFACELPGKLAFEDDRERTHAVMLTEIAVDGGRVSAPEIKRAVNDLCWLSLPLVTSEGLRSVVFTSRVVWVRPEEIGLVFSGAPSFALRNRGLEEGQTQSQPLARRPPKD